MNTPFPAGLPEDGELDLNIVIPTMQARIRELEGLVQALIVNQFCDAINTDNSHATNTRRMLSQRAISILKENE